MIENIGLFPIPISIIDIPEISKNELEAIKQLEFVPWYGSIHYHFNDPDRKPALYISKERQVLSTVPALEKLKNSVMEAAKKYWEEVLGVDPTLNLKFRHSWVTRHRKGEKNPPHTHTTSLFVGCVYLQVNENSGKLVFKKDTNYLNLFPTVADVDFRISNLINTKSYSIQPRQNSIVFFPSHLEHYTSPNNSDDERYALNVDFWFEGTVRKESGGFESTF
jgi:uncharacterized protein (TIGR02466 family)